MFWAIKIFVPAIQWSKKLQNLASCLPGCTQKSDDEMSKLLSLYLQLIVL